MSLVIFSDAPGAVGPLTVLERQVLDLVADGLTDQEIGDRLGFGRSRAKETVARLGMFLDAPGRPGIVAQAYRRGLLAGPDPVPDGRGVLTRELFDILVLIAAGESNGLIAARLGLSVDQVKTRVVKLLKVLDARGREHAIRQAVDLGALTLVPKGAGR